MATDAWGEEIDLPGEMLRQEEDGSWSVRCWAWPDPTVFCRGHRAACGGTRWAPDTAETRAAHPGGKVAWLPAHECHGTHSVHG